MGRNVAAESRHAPRRNNFGGQVKLDRISFFFSSIATAGAALDVSLATPSDVLLQRLLVVLYGLFYVYASYGDRNAYRKIRPYIIFFIRAFVPWLGVGSSPAYALARLNAEPSTGVLASYFIEPMRILIGSSILISLGSSLMHLPIWASLLSTSIGMFAMRNTTAMCSSPLLTSTPYQHTLGNFSDIMGDLADGAVWRHFPVALPRLETPAQQCCASMSFLQIMLGVALPIFCLLWYPPHSLFNEDDGSLNKWDQSIVQLAYAFTKPNKRLLEASGLGEEDEIGYGARFFMSLFSMAAVWVELQSWCSSR